MRERQITAGLPFKVSSAFHTEADRGVWKELSKLSLHICSQQRFIPGSLRFEFLHLAELQSPPLLHQLSLHGPYFYIVCEDISISDPFSGVDKACLYRLKSIRS